MSDQSSSGLEPGGAKVFARRGFLSNDAWRCVFETGALFFVLVAFDYAVLGEGSLGEISPHPFWIPVVLISVQYGTLGGVFAALCAVVIFRLYGLPSSMAGQDYYQHLIGIWTQPALWLIGAVVVGEIRARHIVMHDDLFAQMGLFKEQRQKMSEYSGILEEQVSVLEHEIATSNHASVDHLLGEFHKLSELNSRSLSDDLPAIMEEIFGPVAFSVYECGSSGDRGAELVVAHGHEDDQQLKRSELCALSLPLFHAVAKEGRQLCVLKPRDGELLGDQGLFASAIFAPGCGQVLGVLTLDALDPEMIKPRTGRLLRMVCVELGEAIATNDAGSGDVCALRADTDSRGKKVVEASGARGASEDGRKISRFALEA